MSGESEPLSPEAQEYFDKQAEALKGYVQAAEAAKQDQQPSQRTFGDKNAEEAFRRSQDLRKAHDNLQKAEDALKKFVDSQE